MENNNHRMEIEYSINKTEDLRRSLAVQMEEIQERRTIQQFETLYKQKLGEYEKCCDNIHKIAKSLSCYLTTSNQVTDVSSEIERAILGRKKGNGEKELDFSEFL